MTEPLLRSDFGFFNRLRVRYSDIDGQMVVYNAHYLRFFDGGTVEYMRHLGVPLVPDDAFPWDFHIAHSEVDYRRPIQFDEIIDVGVRTERMGRSSWTLQYGIFGEDNDTLYAEGRMVAVAFDSRTAGETKQSTPMPDWLKTKAETWEAELRDEPKVIIL
ncbi:MAG: thioesterase family protein [Pseudomonadota bacterium]